LIDNGYPIPLVESGVANKGYFGTQTRDAVMMYQESNETAPTGVIESGSYKAKSPVFGAVTGPDYYNTLNLYGGVMYGNTNATSSVTTGTMKVSDVAGYSTVLLTPTGAAATKTLTFFASSTAPSWLPKAGNMQETCFYNGTTTAATTITFAAGTGIDLETASSSPTDLVLLAGNTACFKFIRQTATATTFDISALMTEFTNAD
jgi:hypothetical protein